MKLPSKVVINKKVISRSRFMEALIDFADEEGYSYDPFDRACIWSGVVDNRMRSDNRTEREVWLPLLNFDK